MDGGESILDAIFEEDNLDDVQDIEMHDVEEGELVEQNSQTELGQSSGGDVKVVNQDSCSKNRRRKNNKKKNRRKKGSSGPNVTDINRFVLDVCKRLKERKSYLVWTAVGCLGASALSDIVKEVDAIQACGGQKTADGRRFRTGGGILWSILKAREPNAYKEIMKKGKEFEKQFRQAPVQNKDASSERIAHAFSDQTTASVTDDLQLAPQVQNQLEKSNIEGKRTSALDRIRVPVAYDDLLGEEDQKDAST
uniref:Phosphorylated adapter RNA export protein n=1 Tax=Davidia involucrata TaxID=16924 RepID=A0A5B7AMM4_DAVIN